jgi:hypothetical protein
MGGEENDIVTQLLDLPCPVMGGSACLHDDGRLRSLGKEGKELGPTWAIALGDLPGPVRDGNLEDILCQINSDERIVHVDSSYPRQGDSGTLMPIESQEESIPSMNLSKRWG